MSLCILDIDHLKKKKEKKIEYISPNKNKDSL